MPLPALVIMAMMGVPQDRLYDVKAWSDDIMLFHRHGAGDRTSMRVRSEAVAMAALFRDEIGKRRAGSRQRSLEPP
jgi:cytochrome P450